MIVNSLILIPMVSQSSRDGPHQKKMCVLPTGSLERKWKNITLLQNIGTL